MKPIIPLLCALLLLSCKKEKEGTPTQAFRFVNHTGVPLTLDFYKSRGDYAASKKLVTRVSLSDEVSVNLEPDKTYYLDWYSSDFLISNWQNVKSDGEALPAHKFEALSDIHQVSVSLPEEFAAQSYNRAVLISDNKISQNWKAVAFYKDFGNADAWNTLPEYMKVIHLTTQKDFNISFRYQDSLANDLVQKSTMKIYYDRFRIQFTSSSYLKGEVLPATPFSSDTLYLHLTEDGSRKGRYVLVKDNG